MYIIIWPIIHPIKTILKKVIEEMWSQPYFTINDNCLRIAFWKGIRNKGVSSSRKKSKSCIGKGVGVSVYESSKWLYSPRDRRLKKVNLIGRLIWKLLALMGINFQASKQPPFNESPFQKEKDKRAVKQTPNGKTAGVQSAVC